jgi:hypothetical protein
MPKIKPTKCLICGNETLQGTMCALCKAGIPQMHKELLALLVEDNNPNLLKKLKSLKRYKNISLN